MGKSIAGQTGGGVSNAGKGGDPQATLAGHDSFRDGTHAHGIGTEFSVSSNFGRSFVIGTAHGAIRKLNAELQKKQDEMDALEAKYRSLQERLNAMEASKRL